MIVAMPEDIKAVLRRNLVRALGRGDHEEAASILERLKCEDPLSRETRGLELEYLVKSGRLADARPLAKQLLTLFPSSARILYLAGLLAYRLRDYATAETHLRESHHIYAHWRTLHLTGKALTQQGRLEEAETILLPLAEQHPHVHLDLAWLHERKEDVPRALRSIEIFLEVYPENRFARGQRLRLRARALEPRQLLEEVESLLELGEEPPEELLPDYVETLLRLGEGSRAREFIHGRLDRLGPAAATRIGWACYRLQAHDLAVELFMKAFPENRGNVKFLTSLEAAASRAGRLADLVPLYEAECREEKRLHGRLRSLRQRL